jgi:hypothetical protein
MTIMMEAAVTCKSFGLFIVLQLALFSLQVHALQLISHLTAFVSAQTIRSALCWLGWAWLGLAGLWHVMLACLTLYTMQILWSAQRDQRWTEGMQGLKMVKQQESTCLCFCHPQ